MKNSVFLNRALFTLLLLVSSTSLYSQTYTFPSVGVVNDFPNGSVNRIPYDLTIERLENGDFQMTSLNPQYNTIEIQTTTTFQLYNKEREYYVYKGTIRIGNAKGNCIIRTKIKMSKFAAGSGNKRGFILDKLYEIQIFYSQYGKTIDQMEKRMSLYPIKD